MRDLSNTQPPHAVAPDAPWVQIVARHPVQGAEWDEREDYTVWTSRQGHPVHQGRLLSLAGSTSCLALPLPGPSPTLRTLPPLLPRVIIYLLHSSLFYSVVPSSSFSTTHLLFVDTSQHNLLPRITQRVFPPPPLARSYFMRDEETRRTVQWLVYVACFSS